MKLVLQAERVVDGNGDKPIERGAVLIDNGRIIAVDRQSEIVSAIDEFTEVIDAPGQTIMPGLVEVHTHMHCTAEHDAYEKMMTDDDQTLLMRASVAVRKSLLSGVTTMRDLGSRNQIAFPIKYAIKHGIIPGPRLLVTGTPITTTAGHCNMFGTEADTTEQVISAVRTQAKMGADHIKIMSTGGNFTPRSNTRAVQYSYETIRAAVEDAERLGMTVAAHCHGTAGVKNCIDSGVHHLVHCSWLSSDPTKEYDYDPKLADAIAAAGHYVDPTVALAPLRYDSNPDDPVFQPGGVYQHLPQRYSILRDMLDRGVKFIAGLDAGMPQGRFGEHAWVPRTIVEELGVSPMDAIVSSTKTSAEALGVADITGTIKPGKSADIIIVDGDPTVDIKALHTVSTVLMSGDVVKRSGIPLV